MKEKLFYLIGVFISTLILWLIFGGMFHEMLFPEIKPNAQLSISFLGFAGIISAVFWLSIYKRRHPKK